MNKSLTIVLPVYNAESQLLTNVTELLELASELTPEFCVLIVDDGSTDSTHEIAVALAARYPQVLVRRHRTRRGLGATIDYVQRRMRSDAVMVHDGVTAVNPQQMRHVWQNWIATDYSDTAAAAAPVDTRSALLELADLPAIHSGMERAHRRVLGFQMVTCSAPAEELIERVPSSSPVARPDSPHLSRRPGVGQIPRPPRPKFLSALAAFALGE